MKNKFILTYAQARALHRAVAEVMAGDMEHWQPSAVSALANARDALSAGMDHPVPADRGSVPLTYAEIDVIMAALEGTQPSGTQDTAAFTRAARKLRQARRRFAQEGIIP